MNAEIDLCRERLAGAAQRAGEAAVSGQPAARFEAGALERADLQPGVGQREAQRLDQEAIAARAAADQARQRIAGRAPERAVVGDAVQAEDGVVGEGPVRQIQAAAAEERDERRQPVEEDGRRDAHAPPPTAATPTGHETPVPPMPQ